MTNYAGFKLGGAQYPLTASTANSLLRDADPSIYFALDFLGAMLVTHLGARFAAQVAKIGAGKLFPAGIVAHKVSYDPASYLSQEQVRFPLLAVYRIEDTYDELTTQYRRESGKIGIAYVLSPMTPGQADALNPILKAVASVVQMRIEQGMDPTYAPPGGALGDRVWAAGGLMEIKLDSSKWLDYPGEGNMHFPCWMGTASVLERSDWVPADYLPFAGADVHIDLVDPPDATVTDFIVMATDVG